MSKRQVLYKASEEQLTGSPSFSIPDLRFEECENNCTAICVNAAVIGMMEEESDNQFFVELYFLGPYIAPTIEGTMETAYLWIKARWKEFYTAIHSLPMSSHDTLECSTERISVVTSPSKI